MTGQTSSTHVRKRLWAVLIDNSSKFGGNLVKGLIPGDFVKSSARSFERMFESIRVMLVVSDFESFSTNIPFTSWIVLVRSHFDYPVVFDLQLKAAVLSAAYASALVPCSHISLLSQNIGGMRNPRLR
jgi:hypothetical protein